MMRLGGKNTAQGVVMQAARRGLANEVVLAAKRAAAERAAAARRAAIRRAAALRAAQARAAAARAAAAQSAAQQVAAQPGGQGVTLQAAPQQAVVPTTVAPTGAPQEIAEQMLASYGWAGQFSCLDALWERESGWNVYAENPSSGAYGIPQALPGPKMASAGPDWQSDAATQIRWGLTYIQESYGSPCGAWAHEEAVGWY
jgi:hypothetical protein